MTSAPRELFLETIDWLKESYSQHSFFMERDVVWTVQKRLIDEALRRNLPYRVFHEFGIMKKTKSDLVILGDRGVIEVAAEFKYESSRRRLCQDIWDTGGKFPVVDWGKDGVGRDVERVKRYVESGRHLSSPEPARIAFSLFIDEGGHFRNRPPYNGGRWERWGGKVHVHILQTERR